MDRCSRKKAQLCGNGPCHDAGSCGAVGHRLPSSDRLRQQPRSGHSNGLAVYGDFTMSTHLELVLEALPGADRDRLQDYLRGQGFDPLPMKVGLLLSADLESLKRLLPTLAGTESGELAVPQELRHAQTRFEALPIG